MKDWRRCWLILLSFGIDDKWFGRKGFSNDCIRDIYDEFHSPLPFEHGSRIKLKTPEMLKPVYGVLDSSGDCYGRWFYFLYVEDFLLYNFSYLM